MADEFRSSSRSQVEIIRTAFERGLIGDWRTMAALSTVDEPEIVDPRVVAEFALAFTAGGPPLRILDPWAGLGVTLAALDADGRLKAGLAIEINSAVCELASQLQKSDRVEWRQGDAADVLDGPIGEFDLIVGSPPMSLPRASLRSDRRPQLRLTASKTYTMLVQAALTLRSGGALLVVLPQSFFGRSNSDVREALAAASVYPSAALALPLHSYATSVPLSLVVLTQVKHGAMFAAELNAASDMAAIVTNLRARRDGRLVELGLMVQSEKFVSWRAARLDVEVSAAARAMGFRLVPIAAVASAFHAPRRRGDPFDSAQNAVYLPKIGMSRAVTSIGALVIKPHNYVQLILDPAVADAEYVAAFFSSPLGRKVREQLSTGTFIQQISLTSLRAGYVPLPTGIEQQRSAVGAARKLGEVQQSIGTLERQLWERPLQASRIETELRKILEGDGIEHWMESLPFPLASVLWRYRAEEDVQRRCEYLVHFFEGTTVFLVDVLLSGLHADPRVLADVARGRTMEVSYTRGSIGIWANLLSRLARRVRDLNSQDAPLAGELFRISDSGRLDGIAGKSVVAALRDEASSYRRDWVGHAAVVSSDEWRRRLALAEATLARVRTGIGDAFDGWEVVRAGRGANRGGVYSMSIERLVGSRRPFVKTNAELREMPEENRLYMLEVSASLLLRLNPLFTLKRSPESVEDACYFYDRIQDGGVRWISYHYEPLAEVVDPDTEVVALIEELNLLG